MASNDRDPGPLLTPGMAAQRLAGWQADFDELVARTRAMSTRLGALRATASDPRGLVEVTLDARGGLVDIRFGERLQLHDPGLVARTVMSTVREARRRAVDQSCSIIGESLGADSPAARELMIRAAEQLRAPGGDRR